MSDWNTVQIHFDPFGPLKPPVKSALQALEVVESILEALLDLVKPFLLDLSNPLRAIISLLLASVRTIINQVRSSGFSILLVHPDFSRQDLSAVFQSVSGSYPAFESKVFGKFHDTADLFRPTYPDGSAVAMLVFYIGVESPGDLITQLTALLNLIKHPKLITGLPAPTDLKVLPALQSSDSAANIAGTVKNFKQLFGNSYSKSLVLEWRMPSAPVGTNTPGFINQFSTFVNAFRIPSFIVERSVTPTGEAVITELDTQTTGKNTKSLMDKYGFPRPSTQVQVVEDNGNVYQNFADARIDVSGARLTEGFATGTYRFIDDDPALVSGQTYYYRVRAYFGKPTTWLTSGIKLSKPGYNKEELQTVANSIGKNADLVKTSGNQKIIRYGQGVVMGQPSSITKGFIPKSAAEYGGFNPYEAIYDAVRAGLLLNFEFPQSLAAGDTAFRSEQKTGWGTLSVAGGQISLLKSGFSNAIDLSQNIIFKTTARRIANNVLTSIQSAPKLIDLLRQKWVNEGVSATAVMVLGPENASGNRVPSINWKFTSISGRGTAADATKIDVYLSKEGTYKDGVPLTGPFPLVAHKDQGQVYFVDAEHRKGLAEFLRLCLSLNASSSYLSWYSVTVGDLFPAFVPFIFDFEQFLKALLKAVQSVVQEIDSIIETIIQKIQQLEAILRTITNLLDLLNINVRVSVLGVTSTSGSADSLALSLLNSTAKPVESPQGFHSGLVMTFGGSGAGSVAAFKALSFILTLNHFS